MACALARARLVARRHGPGRDRRVGGQRERDGVVHHGKVDPALVKHEAEVEIEAVRLPRTMDDGAR